MMNGPSEDKPAIVPPEDKQAGEARERRRRWCWAERTVWTDRMLATLEEGVKGGVWYSMIDKVWSMKTLAASFVHVKRNDGAAGVDHQTIAMFDEDWESNLQKLHEQLKTETYQPRSVRRKWVPKPGTTEKRPLGIPTVRDRVVQGATRAVLKPIFERDFAEQSYGFRPGRVCKDALRRVDELMKAGYNHVVDADLKSYFDTIPHRQLLERMRRKVADGRVLALVEAYLEQGVMDGLDQWTPTEGTPQGAVLSPLLSNVYLDPLDHLMAEKGYEMVRCADDFVILCRSEQEARAALAQVEQWTGANGLTLHTKKTRIVNATRESFEFLGYRFERGHRWPRDKSLRKFKNTVQAKTKRTNGYSLETIIEQVNRTTRGWFAYFKHSHRTTFETLDGWIRMRLRSILRRRRGLRGRGRGADHQRWPNAYFAERGLFSMRTAHARACQSASAVTH